MTNPTKMCKEQNISLLIPFATFKFMLPAASQVLQSTPLKRQTVLTLKKVYDRFQSLITTCSISTPAVNVATLQKIPECYKTSRSITVITKALYHIIILRQFKYVNIMHHAATDAKSICILNASERKSK